MHPTRREFLRAGLGSSTLLACGSTVPAFLAHAASVLGAEPAGARQGRVLVVLELTGGNDGLNTVVPYQNDGYRKHRPRIGVPTRSVLKIDDCVGLHPALGGLAGLLERRELAIVQSVGYPNPTRSHFRSMATWQTARVDPAGDTSGWLARYLAHRPARPGEDVAAVHVSASQLPQAFQDRDMHVPSLVDLEQLRLRLGVPDGPAAWSQRAALESLHQGRAGESAASGHVEFLRRTGLMTFASSARLEEVLRRGRGPRRAYPEYALAKRLRLIAQLVQAGLGTSVYYTQLDGFDTHLNQLGTHPALLQELGDSLRAFFTDLREAGEAPRVLVLVFSEFGRRLAENASGGTDHGTAAPVFLIGPAVRAGLHGPYPDLQDLEDGDPRFAIDFRRVYATVLERWLKGPSEPVLGEAFTPLPIVSA
jgi:uncharacterized protein (DUF1501 family)